MLQLACEEDALKAWQRHGLALEAAVPTELMATSEDPPVRRFAEEEYPRLLQTLGERRAEFEQFVRGLSRKRAPRPQLGPKRDGLGRRGLAL